jgi:hypothetical protein
MIRTYTSSGPYFGGSRVHVTHHADSIIDRLSPATQASAASAPEPVGFNSRNAVQQAFGGLEAGVHAVGFPLKDETVPRPAQRLVLQRGNPLFHLRPL